MKDERLAMRADAAMLAMLDSFRRAHPDLPSRSAAVRILVDLGIEAWTARNASRSPVQAVEAPTPADAVHKRSTASRKPADGSDKTTTFDRTKYQREYMRKRRATPGVRWPKSMTPEQVEAVIKLVEELRPVMSSRVVKAAILERADVKVSHEFVESVARARGIPTKRPGKPPKR